MTHAPSRKLAVILHADVAGSTALVQLDETLAHQRIQEVFRRLSRTVLNHGGVAHEIRGDALVAEFAKVSDAVDASLVFQSENAACNEALPDEVRPVVRIGIAMGEVVVADHTLTGEGVVLAQRLEQLANPGKVCLQGAARETMPKRLPFDYQDLGEREVKGFNDPVRVYAVSLKAGAVIPRDEPAAGPGVAALEVPDKPSIAILPFANTSGDQEQVHIANGITEDIITALTRVSGLHVVARHSTQMYAGKEIDVGRVAQEQGVRYVLEGSVRKGGNRIRVTAQLVDSATGHHLWAEHYDRELEDIFAIQDEIAHKITVELRVQLEEGEQARSWAGGTQSVEAWELMVRADEHINRNIREDAVEARHLAEAALEVDPEYASAWVSVGWSHWQEAMWGWTDSHEQSLSRAFEAALNALRLDEHSSDALALLASIHMLREEHEEAVTLARRASGLAPNHAGKSALLAMVLSDAGKPKEAVQYIKRAMSLCPIFPAWYSATLGKCYRLMGEYDNAISAYSEAIRREPESNLARIWLAYVLVESGLVEEANSITEDILRVEPNFTVSGWIRGSNHTQTERALLRKNLSAAGLPE